MRKMLHLNSSSKRRGDDDGEEFQEYLSTNAHLVGYVPKDYPSNDLPFLFRMLSLGNSTSAKAQVSLPICSDSSSFDMRTDENKKAEMIIAVSAFEMMCGFRKISEIQSNIGQFPELGIIVGPDVTSSFSILSDEGPEDVNSNGIKTLFEAVLRCDDTVATEQLTILVNRLTALESGKVSSPLHPGEKGTSEHLLIGFIIKLYNDSPHDKRALYPIFLNCMVLSPGACLLLESSQPYGFISGECVECAAKTNCPWSYPCGNLLSRSSKDVDNFCILNYQCGSRNDIVPISIDEHSVLYRPPCTVFAEAEIEQTSLSADAIGDLTLSTLLCGSIVLFQDVPDGTILRTVDSEGGASTLAVCKGDAVFIGANCSTHIEGGLSEAASALSVAGSDQGIVSFLRIRVNMAGQPEPSSESEDDCESSVGQDKWTMWFCNLHGNEIFCEVDKAYIEDSFNLFGLKQYVGSQYSKVLSIILDKLVFNDDDSSQEMMNNITLLYGMIHARYIVTTHGLDSMYRKYIHGRFGECPRFYCKQQKLLPMGLSDEPKQGPIKLFCARCQDIYNCAPNQRHIDGAFFGTTFPHLFFMTYCDLVPGGTSGTYSPRVFGFKVHKSSKSLSKRVEDAEEEDQDEKGGISQL